MPSTPDITFELLERRYNFRLIDESRRAAVFLRLLAEECAARPAPVRVLDIGCGGGIDLNPDSFAFVRQHAAEVWGLEPDPKMRPPAGAFDNFQHALLEHAELPENYFDVAYSFMVMEHVEDPARFMRAVHRTLKPGGTYVFATINGTHYFSRIARLMRALRIDDLVLRLVRGKTVDDYHYPAYYRVNTRRAIARHATPAGFLDPRCVYIENTGPRPYMPGPLKPLHRLMMLKRDVIRDPESLLLLIAKVTKKG